MLDENVHGGRVLIVLVVDGEGLLVQTLLDGDPRDLLGVVVLKLVDVPNNLALVGSDGRQEQKVLERPVVRERRGLEDNFLEQLHQLGREVVVDKGLDGDGDVIGVSRLRHGGRDDLVDELSSVDVVRDEHLRPEVGQTTLDEVPSLVLEHRVGVGDGDELLVAESLGERDEGEVGVSLLAVLPDNEGLVELYGKRREAGSVLMIEKRLVEGNHVVLLEELLGVVVRVDKDLGHGVEQCRVLVSSRDPGLDER